MTSEPYKILLVEDDDIDYKQVVRTFKKLRISNPVIRAEDGSKALEMLRSLDDTVTGKLIVLLDIGLPKFSGLEVLEAIRADPKIRKVPVFMLTSSDHHRDIDRAHDLVISGYLVKPIEIDGLMTLLEKLDAFLRIVELPSLG